MENRNLLSQSQFKLTKNSPSTQGLPLNKSLKYGPNTQRNCTDFLATVIYILFTTGIVFMAIQAYETGAPQKLIAPFDSEGRQCGFGEAEQYPYLYFQNPNAEIKNFACVKECPQNLQEIECLVNSKISKCSQLEKYQTKSFMKVCIPLENVLYEQVQQALNTSAFDKYVSDLVQTWKIFGGVVITSFYISFVFLFLLRQCAGILTWGMLLLTFLSSSLIGTFCYISSYNENKENYPEIMRNDQNLQIMAGVFWIFALIILIATVFLYKKIQVSIAITKASSVYTRQNFTAFFIPVLTFLAVSTIIFYAFNTSLHILSSGNMRKNSLTPFGTIEWNEDMRNQMLLTLFGTFWNVEIALGMCAFTIASSASIWYFSQGSSNSSPMLTSIFRLIRYHLGSVIFGSFILAFFETVQVIFASIYQNMKKSMVASEQNPISQCFLKCSNCFFECFNKFMRFISYNAYCMMALSGDNFCVSAKKGFYVFERNMSQYAISQGMGLGFSLIGRFFIGIIGSGVGYFMMSQVPELDENLYSTSVPLIAFFLVSFLIGSIFMGIFERAGDSLLMCILVDKESNEGQAKSVPASLQQFTENYM